MVSETEANIRKKETEKRMVQAKKGTEKKENSERKKQNCVEKIKRVKIE